jgi:hypothetical protein
MRHRISASGVVGIGLKVGGARFLQPAGLLVFMPRFFVGPGNARPLRGPKLGILAAEISENRFDVRNLCAAKDFTLAGQLTNFRFDFVETLDPAHDSPFDNGIFPPLQTV